MSKSTNKFIAFMALMHSMTALAANELVVFVDSTNVSEESLTAVLDGSTSEAVDGNGFVSLDLVAGQHSLQIKQGGQSLHSFRFTSAAGQLVDIAVILSAGNNPQVTIENYFKTETAGEKKKAQRGGLSGQVNANGLPVAEATVSLVGTTIAVDTDEFGRYELKAPRGIYSLQVSHPDYGRKKLMTTVLLAE
jgi:hypothetical protein